MMYCHKNLVRGKNWSRRTKFVPPLAKNGSRARAAFTSLVEAQQQTAPARSSKKKTAATSSTKPTHAESDTMYAV